MNINKQESEVLSIFTQTPQQFPMINKCINKSIDSISSVSSVSGQVNKNAETVMEVIWAGKFDAQNNRIICRLSTQEGSIVNSYFAKVTDKSGNTVAKESFVSFYRNMAFAKLTVPKKLFDDCSVQMEMAMIGASVRTVSKAMPLNIFDVEDMGVTYDICAPVIKRKGSYDRIKISYYAGSSLNAYDYVYPASRENRIYFPSCGEITADGIEFEDAKMVLTISDGSNVLDHPIAPKIEVEDSVISYSFEEKWGDKKLKEIFLRTDTVSFEYLLIINAYRTNGHQLTFLITNIDKIIKEERSHSIKRIPDIDVYLDCFAEGTEISMSDGSSKAIESIQTGDLIKTKGGKKTAVKEVQVQEDYQVLTLILESGRKLSLTAGHAVYTEDGIFPASRLKEGQAVITEDGTDKIRHIIPQCERTYRVYAIFSESNEEWLFANGVMVHSSDSGDVFKDRDWVREELPKEWLVDYDNALKAGIVYGRS